MSLRPHDCKKLGLYKELIYTCSRCGQCYVCKHQVVFQHGKWIWLCPDAVKRPVISDGRLLDAT